MRRRIVTAMIVAGAVVAAGTAQAQYYGDNLQSSTVTGLGAGIAGAAIAGPYGFVVGSVVGAAVGVPRYIRRNQECWYDRAGMRHCRYY